MSHVKLTLGIALAATLLVAGAAKADPWDQMTYVTVNAPIELPGATLPAGSYTFRLLDSMSNRHIVVVTDRDRTKTFATILAVPAVRQRPADEAVITFREAPADAPPAVHYWYYPGDTSGHEFVYPKSQALRIAASSGESVLSADAESADYEAMKSAEITRVEPGAETAARESSTAVEPQGTVAMRQETPSTTDEKPAGTSGRARVLPQTASNLPLVGLIGLIALGGAAAARVVRRSRV